MTSVLESTTWQIIGVLVTFFSVSASIGIWLSTKIYNIGANAQKVTSIEKQLREDIKPQLRRMEDRFEVRMNELSKQITDLYKMVSAKK